MELIVNSSTEDGYIENASTVDTGSSSFIVWDEDSSGSFETRGFLFFDTSALPSRAEIVSVSLYLRLLSSGLTGDPDKTSYMHSWICDDACLGSTLDTGDWGNPSSDSQEWAGGIDIRDISGLGNYNLSVWPGENPHADYVAAGPQINRSGITGVRIVLVNEPDAAQAVLEYAAQNHPVSSLRPKLTIKYRMPQTLMPLTGAGRA